MTDPEPANAKRTVLMVGGAMRSSTPLIHWALCTASIKNVNARHLETGVLSPHGSLQTTEQFCDYNSSYYDSVFAQRSKFGSNLMFVRYEDVVSKLEQTIAHISRVCGAIYAGDAMTRFTDEHAQASNFRKDLRLQDPMRGAFWSELYTKDLSTERMGRYRQTLSNTEVAEIESRLGGFGKPFHYW